MGREIRVAALGQIPRGEGRNFAVDGTTVAVFRTQADEVFATQPDCPHRGGPLADGLVGGTTLLCPLHEYGFDLRSGTGIGNDSCVATYPARVDEEGAVRVTL